MAENKTGAREAGTTAYLRRGMPSRGRAPVRTSCFGPPCKSRGLGRDGRLVFQPPSSCPLPPRSSPSRPAFGILKASVNTGQEAARLDQASRLQLVPNTLLAPSPTVHPPRPLSLLARLSACFSVFLIRLPTPP